MKSRKIISLLLVFFSIPLMSIVNQQEQNLPVDDYVYDFVDEMPKFPGGKKTMDKYLSDNVHYPTRLKKAGITNKVYVECVIEKDGSVSNPVAFKNDSKKLEKEALRVVLNMPNWIPGKNKGKLVRVKQIIGVKFE